MRRSRLPLQKIYTIVQKYLKEKPLVRLRQRGRPRTYDDTLILTLWLYQTLWRASYREVLEIAWQASFPTPAMSTYHYRVSQLSLKLFQYLFLQIGKDWACQNLASWHFLLVDGTGFGFQDRYALSWSRRETLHQVHAHVRLVILAMVNEKKRGFLMGAAVGPPYASKIHLLRDISKHMDSLPPLSVVGDRAYDSVELLELLIQLGAKPALQMKGTWQYGLRHPLQQEFQKNWERWGQISVSCGRLVWMYKTESRVGFSLNKGKHSDKKSFGCSCAL